MLNEEEQNEIDFALDMSGEGKRVEVWFQDGKVGLQVYGSSPVIFEAEPDDIIAYLVGGVAVSPPQLA